MSELNKLKIRKAKKSDSKAILKLIIELAEFEKLNPPDKTAAKRLMKDAFSKNPAFEIILAETNNEVAGYAFYFFSYSSFRAKRTLYLEDIFVTRKFRSKGIGNLFFKKLIEIAGKNKCGGMEWIVLDWNENAIRFYENIGAKEMKEWRIFRLSF